MYGRTRSYDFRLAARDRKLRALHSLLNLAHLARNHSEVTRLGRQIAAQGQTLG
jgi:hypothetical protein